MADLEIIDAHTHMVRSEYRGREVYQYQLHHFGPRSFNLYCSHNKPKPPEEPVAYGTVAEFLKIMQATGVAHMNFVNYTYSGLYYLEGSYLLPDEPTRREAAEADLKARVVGKIRDNNEWAVGIVTEHKNISFFCGVDPVVMDEQTLLAELEDKTRRGAIGVKLVPDDFRLALHDRGLWPIYDFCNRKELPILVATLRSPLTHPRNFAPVMEEFPRLKVICAHGGSVGGEDAVAELAKKYENFCADISLRLIEVADGEHTPEEMVALIRRIGTDRVMWGSNFPHCELLVQLRSTDVTHLEGEGPQMTNYKRQVEVLKTLPLTDDEREKIASKNFKRITGLGLQG